MSKRSFFMNGVVIVAALSFLLPLVASAQKAEMYPKIDNFVFFLDQSGSMQKSYKAVGKSKISVAKDILLNMNKEIPELNYKGAVELFAPDKEILAPTLYKTDTFQKALEKISTKFPVFGRYTPMAPGLTILDNTLKGLAGRTAVILLSDGEANRGGDPVAEAQALKQKYGSNLCFHVISLANKPAAEKVLEDIAQLNNCIHVTGADMQNPELLKNFVKDVFYGVKAKPAERIELRGINFDFDKYNIKSESEAILDSGVQILKSHPEIKVVIEGHTDSRGTEQYNQKLSEQRAMSVYNYFKAHGIASSRMKTVGYGELHPKADNSTAEGRAINRRVELKVEK